MRVARTLLFLAVGALVWAIWLSWGFDGTYPAWQVAACGITAVAATALGAWRLGPVPAVLEVALPMAVGLTGAWTLWARADETGLYAVGAILMALGTGVGLSAVAAIASIVGHRSEVGSHARG